MKIIVKFLKILLIFFKERVFAIENNEKLKFRNLILYTVFLFTLFGIFLWVTFFVVIRKTKEYQLDSFYQMDLMKALVILQNKNLKVRIIEKKSKKYKRYAIIEQRPSAGTIVKKNRVITLTVSSGNFLLKVPSLVGKTPLQAKKQLLKLFLEKEVNPNVVIEEIYSKKKKGKIIEQRPKENQKISSNEDIFLFVSKGIKKQQFIYKNYKNRSFYPIQKKLEKMGIQVKIFFQKSKKSPGKIISQNIKSGTTINLAEKNKIEFLVAVKKTKNLDLLSRLRLYSFDWKSNQPSLKKIKIIIEDAVNSRTLFLEKIITGNPFEISYFAYGKGVLKIFINDEIYDTVYF